LEVSSLNKENQLSVVRLRTSSSTLADERIAASVRADILCKTKPNLGRMGNLRGDAARGPSGYAGLPRAQNKPNLRGMNERQLLCGKRVTCGRDVSQNKANFRNQGSLSGLPLGRGQVRGLPLPGVRCHNPRRRSLALVHSSGARDCTYAQRVMLISARRFEAAGFETWESSLWNTAM